jgi:hypothetical protein
MLLLLFALAFGGIGCVCFPGDEPTTPLANTEACPGIMGAS